MPGNQTDMILPVGCGMLHGAGFFAVKTNALAAR
jgi:hypothetical protein